MYGVPADLPVNVFVGKEFNQIGLGRFQIQFHCSGTGSIFVEGRWELRTDRRRRDRPPRSFTLASKAAID